MGTCKYPEIIQEETTKHKGRSQVAGPGPTPHETECGVWGPGRPQRGPCEAVSGLPAPMAQLPVRGLEAWPGPGLCCVLSNEALTPQCNSREFSQTEERFSA